MDAQRNPEPSLGELLGALSRETGTLVRQEVQLAGAEMSAKGKTAAKHLSLVLSGGGFAHVGLLVVLLGVVFVIGQWLPLWAGAFIVGAVVAIGGVVMLMSGLASLRKLDLTPTQAVEVLREEKALLKEQFR